MLFSMVERGANGEFVGDKGKFKATGIPRDAKPFDGEEAIWAVILTKELWKKSIWFVPYLLFHRLRC
jgi:protein SDA1